jgi:hypothetical protein
MNPARRLSLRPSAPDKQAEKNGKIRCSAGRRVAHKAALAEHRAEANTAEAISAEELRERERDWRRWCADNVQPHAAILREDEQDRLIAAAYSWIITRTMSHDDWQDVKRALRETIEAARPPEALRTWVKPWLPSGLPDGW